ncbi:T6SS amidase immunity protein Tai4 family protein [Niveibacterium umoris]|uniref:Type VI secretion protein n=1 Tax=Niveibacterium umoris TaxID=1193620 RepID=A0A840BJD7_9RHOO|nr:T6SS amidase immunity protein Tai4 family protein [Niveibacterium umoris]MBB4013651.1 hypothetical protein [Niveibacterium umoris]
MTPRIIVCLCLATLGTTTTAVAQEPTTAKYSQKTLLKNWALSRCLAQIAPDEASRNDANATAAAYLEFGHQPIETYEAIDKLVVTFIKREYAGSTKSSYNSMKCIDLFHSRDLDAIVRTNVGGPRRSK